MSTTTALTPAMKLQRRANRRRSALYLVLIAIALVAPFVAYPVFLMKVLCFALFACAFNLLLGYAGLLSFGHAAFLATGGCFTGIMLASYPGLTPELGILIGTFAAVVLGTLFGALAIRRQGIYFAMVTLALAQMMFFFFVQAPFTGGEDGLHGVPRGELFGLISLKSNLSMYYFVLAVFVIGFAIIQRTVHSPYGQVLKAIRENEAARRVAGLQRRCPTSWWPSCSPPAWRAWRARPRRWSSSSPRLPTPTGTCPAR